MKWLAILTILLFTAIPAEAQSQSETLRVATRIVKPFVFEEGGNLTGFSIDLWREIANQMNVRSTFIQKSTVADLIATTQTNEADVAISAISITADREQSGDFSLPMFDAGLVILTPAQAADSGAFARIKDALFSPSFVPLLLFVILGVIVTGHVIWFFERHRDTGMLGNRNYFPGIFEAFFWAASTLATQADQMPKSSVARFVAVFWMFTAVVFIAFFTAGVTSSLTVQQLKGDIQGPDDLPGKRVATVQNSTSAQYLAESHIQTATFPTIDDATQSLLNGEADAVVYDAPVLMYFASHEGKGKAQVVGSVFRKEAYGILFPANGPYRKPVNEALLRLKENGTYDRLVARWFGADTADKGSSDKGG